MPGAQTGRGQSLGWLRVRTAPRAPPPACRCLPEGMPGEMKGTFACAAVPPRIPLFPEARLCPRRPGARASPPTGTHGTQIPPGAPPRANAAQLGGTGALMGEGRSAAEKGVCSQNGAWEFPISAGARRGGHATAGATGGGPAPQRALTSRRAHPRTPSTSQSARWPREGGAPPGQSCGRGDRGVRGVGAGGESLRGTNARIGRTQERPTGPSSARRAVPKGGSDAGDGWFSNRSWTGSDSCRGSTWLQQL